MTTLLYGIIYGLLFALACCIAAIIAILASKSIPKTFDREQYWTCFAASGFGAMILFMAAQRLARTGAASHVLRTLVADVALFLVGISMGCGAAIFVFKKPAKEE
jgi:hypothetical protein